MASSKVVLYSCIVNRRDRPKVIEFRDDIQYVLFSDEEIIAPGWDVRPIVWVNDDPVRTSRYHKHHPFVLFPDAEYTIWLDATHYPYTSILGLLTDNDITLMKHFSRTTVKEEVKACVNMDSPEVMQRQYHDYLKEGFLDDMGLYSTTCLVRKNTERTKSFQRMWWENICKYSRRDQLSFPYCLWKAKENISCGVLPGFCREKSSPFFKMISHYKKFVRIL